MFRRSSIFSFFFFNDTATTEIYTLSLHDALPISLCRGTIEHTSRAAIVEQVLDRLVDHVARDPLAAVGHRDRKSTRLNSSHLGISYAVFCLKKKKQNQMLSPAADQVQTYVLANMA